MKKMVKRGRTIRVIRKQRGKSDIQWDRAIKALKPGKRISASGNIYWETRRNRSDLKGRL